MVMKERAIKGRNSFTLSFTIIIIAQILTKIKL
jgi:hypothetical protein